MSHIVKAECKVLDLSTMEATCKRLGYGFEVGNTDQRFSGGVATLRLPDWHHGVAIKEDGTVEYDNYNGNWGNQSTLDNLLKEYAADVVEQEAFDQGLYNVMRNTTPEGDIELEITIGE